MGAPVQLVCIPAGAARARYIILRRQPLSDAANALAETEPDVVFLCNPNNPTGRLLTEAEWPMLYDAAPDALWVVDEAYADFADEPITSIPWIERGNWLVLRSMTKDFALGGLRLGYVVGAPDRGSHRCNSRSRRGTSTPLPKRRGWPVWTNLTGDVNP